MGGLRLDLPFRGLIIITLKSNVELAVEHKRLPCDLFLDLYLKRSLSERLEAA